MMRLLLSLLLVPLLMTAALARPVTILALGDSLTAGYGLDPASGFVPRLEAALKAKGIEATVINGGVSGDTAAQGQARLDWVLTPEVNAVIVELGANDVLRGLDPAQAEAALRQILDALKARHVPVLIAGMRAPPNLGPDYVSRFEAIYPRLAKDYGYPLYPFFLDGVAGDAKLNQADGLHPTAAGVDIIVARMLPMVESLIGQIPQ